MIGQVKSLLAARNCLQTVKSVFCNAQYNIPVIIHMAVLCLMLMGMFFCAYDVKIKKKAFSYLSEMQICDNCDRREKYAANLKADFQNQECAAAVESSNRCIKK